MQHPKVELCAIETLRPYANNARTHSKKQIQQIANSIERFGFTNPVLIADDNTILAGHGRVEGAKLLGWSEVPIIRLSHLNADERRAYVLADNKLAANAGWDEELLAIELGALLEVDFDVDLTGFSAPEIDLVLHDGLGTANTNGAVPSDERLDHVPVPGDGPAVTKPGDLWVLGRHRLICGDAGSTETIKALCRSDVGSDRGLALGSTSAPASASASNAGLGLRSGMDMGPGSGIAEQVDMMFTDPPYNVPIDGHVSGLGRHRHREFAEASGEMSREAFTSFLSATLANAASVMRDGAIAYVCMDWRHIAEVMAAGETVFDELKNVCVWNKSNAGMGTFYRSKHELVFVFKKGTGPHINNFGLGNSFGVGNSSGRGDGGRYRTNVWDYAGVNSFGRQRDEALAMHPTVKPVAMIADAMRDCSKRKGIILDIFGGSGSTLIAAESSGRAARLVEIDPIYCDVIIRRWERLTGDRAILAMNMKDEGPGGRAGPVKRSHAERDAATDKTLDTEETAS